MASRALPRFLHPLTRHPFPSQACNIKLQRFQEALTRAEMLAQEQVARNEKLSARNRVLEGERDEATAGQRQAEVRLKQAQGDLARAMERLDQKKEGRNADNADWQERWDALEHDLKVMRGELRETRVQCQDALHQKDASLISRIEQLTKELTHERSGSQKYRDANANEVLKLREQLKLMSSSLHEAQTLAEQVPVLQSQLEQIKSSFSSTIASIKQSHAEDMQRVRDSQRQRLAELESMLHEKDVALANLNADIAARAVELQEVQRDKAELQVSRDGLRAEVSELKRRLEQALADAVQASQALKLAQEEVANQTGKATILSAEVKAQHDLVGKLRARIKQLEASMTKVEQEFKADLAHMNDVTTEQAHRLSIVEKEANTAQRALTQSLQDVESLSATLVDYDSNLAELKQCFDLSQAALKAAHDALATLDNESHARISAAQSALLAQLEASRSSSSEQANMVRELAECHAELKKKDGLLSDKIKQLAALESAQSFEASKVNLNLTFESQGAPISEAMVQDHKKIVAELSADIDVHQQATAKAEAEIAASRQQLKMLSTDLREAQGELNRCKTSLFEATSTGLLDRAKANALQQEVKYLESRMESMSKEHERAVDRVQTVLNQRIERMGQ